MYFLRFFVFIFAKTPCMKYVCIAILACLFVSCNPYGVQKAYFVEPPVTAVFDSIHQTKIKLSGYYLSHTNLQVMHSFSNHHGVFASGLIGYQGWAKNSGYSGFADKGVPNLAGSMSSGYIWYNQSPEFYLECLAGYGFQINNARFYEKWISPTSLLGGPYFSQDVHSAFHRLSIQPSVFSGNSKRWGFSLRAELVYCPYYYYNYAVEFYNPEETWYSPVKSDYYDRITFYGKWFSVLTPVISYRNKTGKTPYGFYFGANFTSLVKKEFNDLTNYEEYLWPYVLKKHPASASIIFGCEYTFPMKLKK
jgi:hypothetical protein